MFSFLFFLTYYYYALFVVVVVVVVVIFVCSVLAAIQNGAPNEAPLTHISNFPQKVIALTARMVISGTATCQASPT